MALQFQKENSLNSKHTHTQTHKHSKQVRHFLYVYLNVFEIRQNKFAHYIGVKLSNLSILIKGERSLNHDFAPLIGTIFRNDPMLGVGIQNENKHY